MLRALLLATLTVSTLGLPAHAQPLTVTVSDCDWQASARNIPEPWEANSASFANGNVRLALMDTIEPAQGWAWLMVLSPPFEDWGGRQCRMLGLDGMGFAGMDFAALDASYDPAIGLTFTLPVQTPAPEGGRSALLRLDLNQSTGSLRARLDGGE